MISKVVQRRNMRRIDPVVSCRVLSAVGLYLCEMRKA
jgi:hypothetical protein